MKTFHSTTRVNFIDLSFCSCTHLSQTEAFNGKFAKCYEAGLNIVCRETDRTVTDCHLYNDSLACKKYDLYL